MLHNSNTGPRPVPPPLTVDRVEWEDVEGHARLHLVINGEDAYVSEDFSWRWLNRGVVALINDNAR